MQVLLFHKSRVYCCVFHVQNPHLDSQVHSFLHFQQIYFIELIFISFFVMYFVPIRGTSYNIVR